MADEATPYIQTGPAIPFTVSNTVAITKGAVLALNDEFTALAPVADGAVVAGIAATDKIANDGKTKLGLFRDGIFVMTLSGSGSAGDGVYLIGGSNRVLSLSGNITLSGSRCLGTLLSTGTDGQTVYVEVKPQVINNLVV